MKNQSDRFLKLIPVGESALLVQLADGIDLSINDRVYALDSWMGEAVASGVTQWVPGYASILIHFDPLQTDVSAVQDWFQERFQSCPSGAERHPVQVKIPVRYGGMDGPDLVNVAKIHHLSPLEVVRLHTAPVYRVGMMGFTPGFAYLLGLDTALATPRLENPRTHVPAGSVGIAGGQTGVYPLDSPGGWQLIGRTDATLYDPLHAPHFLLSPGDEVRFVIDEESVVQ
jgi:KipI family sensor histidine kinase inhibitor